MYGMLGTKGVLFNDYVMAAFVTAYGRAILKHIVACVQSLGGNTINIDTIIRCCNMNKCKCGKDAIRQAAGTNEWVCYEKSRAANCKANLKRVECNKCGLKLLSRKLHAHYDNCKNDSKNYITKQCLRCNIDFESFKGATSCCGIS